MQPGTILYLNGTSSAGKSSLAKAVQTVFEEPFLHLGIDTLFAAISPRYQQYGRLDEFEPPAEKGTRWILDDQGRIVELSFGEVSHRMFRGFHAMVAALADEGNHVVVDDVLFEPQVALHCAATLAGRPAYLIGVRCPLAVTERRERERGNRLPGLSRLLFDAPHHFGLYDLELDTGALTPLEGAQRIRRHLEEGNAPNAFARLAMEASDGVARPASPRSTAACTAVLEPATEVAMFTRILLPTDFSPSADAALELARRHFPGAQRRLLHVLDPQRLAADLTSSVSVREEREALERAILDRLRGLAHEGEECVVEIGPAADTILAQAQAWEADLIVMGTHGRTGLAHFLNGSVAEWVVRHARRPVLIEHQKRN